MDAAGIVNTASVSISPILRKLGVMLSWYRRHPYPVDSSRQAIQAFPITRGNSLLHSRACKFTSARFVRLARKRLARQFLVAPTESYLPERGADFEQVLVSTASR
jgi:hypothetical protein